MRPFMREMLEWAESGEGVLNDRFYRRPLAVWGPCRTRIVINEDAPDEAKEHVTDFLRLYCHEKIIGVTEGGIVFYQEEKK